MLNFFLATTLIMLSSCWNKTATQKEPPIKTAKSEKLLQKKETIEFKVLKTAKNDADTPKIGSDVTVHYTGWLKENGKKGKKFDSSLDRNRDFTFTIGKGYVIKGWDQGVMDMRVGEKRELTIPPSLGYGKIGASNIIPPNATLIFEIEILGINHKNETHA